MTRQMMMRVGGVGALLLVLVLIPFMSVSTGGFLPYELNSPGSLQVLAVVLVTAALAVSFDIVFGYTGLNSFGHALFFTLGGYGFALTLVHTDAGFWTALLVGVAAAAVGGIIVNGVALRVVGLSFSMVTIAFAEIAAIGIGRNYWGTGGEEGLAIPFRKLPEQLIGVANTRNLYWLALATFVVVIAVSLWATSTRLGQLWKAIRENELRVNVMGVNTYLVKLIAASLSAALAGVCGIAYVIVLGGGVPHMAGIMMSLSLIVMVVIGGRGRIWGAALGAAVYVLLEQRLPELASSDGVKNLPEAVRIPLSEPQLLFAVVFIALIFFLPGGLAGLFSQLRTRVGSR